MAGFDHHPTEPAEQESAEITKRNTRYGLILFAVYLVLYASFVLLNTFAPNQMKVTPLLGVNLAILYGFGLIASALVLALVYGWLCRSVEEAVQAEKEDE